MDDTRFVSFIFRANTEYSQKSWIEAYNSLRYNPFQVHTFLNSREVSGAFVAGFELYGTRIAKFLEQLSRYAAKIAADKQPETESDSIQTLVGHIVREILLPLLGGAYQHFHSRDALFEFLISAVRLAEGNCLDQLASGLGEAPYLLGKMVSEERNSDLLRGWAGLLGTNINALSDWTNTIVHLVENCESDHRVCHKTERWRLLEALKPYLDQAKHQYDLVTQHLNLQSKAHISGPYRKLNIDIKKSVGTHRSSVAPRTINLPPEALKLLESLGISAPNTKANLTYVINEVETTEALSIMEAVLSTFPCRSCFLRGYGGVSDVPIDIIQTDTEQRLEELDIDSFEGLLGSNLGIWKISLSTQAMKDLKHSKREGNFPHIKEKLEALASGDWARKSVARPVSDDSGRFKVRVFQAWYGNNGRILWQVDVGFDEKHKADCQIVRVWRIGDVKEMLSSLDSVYRAQQTFSPTRIANCKKNVIDRIQNKKIPAVFGDSEQDTIEEFGPRTVDERTPQDMLISGKFHTLTTTMLESIIQDQPRSDFPFDVTGKEVEIIKHFRTATFILGRSGTGKTSCLLYKLLGRYLSRNLVESEKPMRQLLLTRSEPLARKLESEVQLLIDTQLLRVKASAGFNSADDELEVPTHTRDGMDEETTEDLLWLQKKDFPLVCTFGNFLKRLENTIKAYNRRNSSIRTINSITGQVEGQMVDFPIFQAAYWQQLPTALKAGLEPDLVFTEIMGVIKGTTSLLSGLKSLSREEYRSRSSRLAPTFAMEHERDSVYNVFEHYEHKKKRNGDYDGIDRVQAILGELAQNIGLRRRLEAIFEEVYVDEVQDQRPLEIELLLNLVQNPRGIHFAGDSAQCISKDSTFRFSNVKALFYNHFMGSSFVKTDPDLAKPELFPLSRNFRSHQGILSLASFVMDLLWKGFPAMVDKLPPEIGQYLGPKPVIFVGSDLIQLLEMAGSTSNDSDRKPQHTQAPEKATELKQTRNRQVIIVRDHKAQRELESKLDDGSLVFTILQSKGMEYDDVFLFDFFSSSPCSSSFRSLEELLPDGSNAYYGATHMAMCSELKNLYVAITRPRNRLWILESNPGFIVDLFTTRAPKPLVKIKYFSSVDLPDLMSEVRPASATSSREWIETGEQCMERGIFDQALRCFKNAENMQRILWAEASIAEQKGKECRARGDVAGLKSHFKEASGYFIAIGMKERAASCFEASGEFAAAAELWSEKKRHEKAGGLFERADKFEKAADEYYKAGIIYKVLQALYNGKLFDKLVCSLHEHRDKIDDGDRRTYARECNILLREGTIAPKLREMTLNTFISDSEKEEFLKEFHHKKELLEFYIARRRFSEAFNYSVKAGDFDEALELIIIQESGHDANTNETENEGDLPLTEVFKYAQTKKLFSSLSEPSATSIDLSYDQSFAKSSWSHEWAELVAVANGYFKDGIKPERTNIEKTWIKEYLDTIISINIGYFLKPEDDFVGLPLEYVCGLAEIARSLSKGKQSQIPKSILLCLGVVPIPFTGDKCSYMVLSWSKLPMDTKSSRNLDYGNLVKKITAYISKRITNARNMIEKQARNIWGNFLVMSKCDTCVIRGSWDQPEKQQGHGPTCSHEIPSDSQSLRFMQGLAKLCRLLADLEDPSLDFWLENLLSQMTYNSSFLQNAEVITIASQMIRTSDIYSNVLNKLQSAFFKKWKPRDAKNTKNDFSSLLENYKLGLNLNIKPSDLKSTLNNRLAQPQRNHKRSQQPTNDPTYTTFVRYQSLRSLSRTTQFSPQMFCENLDSLLWALDGLRKMTNCLSFYHGSVISIYEDILTFLLFSTRNTDIIIPKSWTKLYMPHWEPVFRAASNPEQNYYLQRLSGLVSSFCDLITSLESSPFGKPSERGVLTRRSVDLLAISLVNMRTEPRHPSYMRIWDRVQRVFNHKGLGAGGIRGIREDLLVKKITQAFQFYNGKDSIVIYAREGRLSKWVESLDMPGIQVALLPIRRQQLYKDKCLEAGLIIHAWRARTLRHRERMRSASGRAINSIQALCRAHRMRKPSRRAYLQSTILMVTSGLELWLLLETVEATFRATYSKAKEMDVFAKHAMELSNREKELSFEPWYLFDSDSPNAFDFGTEELQSRLMDGLYSTRKLGDRIGELMQILERPPNPPKAVKAKNTPKEDPKNPRETAEEIPKAETGAEVKDRLVNEPSDGQKGGTMTGEPKERDPEGKDQKQVKVENEDKQEEERKEEQKENGEVQQSVPEGKLNGAEIGTPGDQHQQSEKQQEEGEKVERVKVEKVGSEVQEGEKVEGVKVEKVGSEAQEGKGVNEAK